MVPSTLANGLWSLIYSPPSHQFFLRKKEGGIYWRFLKQPILNARTRGISQLASFLNKGVASSHVHSSLYIYIYIYLTSSLFSSISSLLVFRERESSPLWELCFRHLVDLVAFAAVLLLRPSLLKEPSTNFVSHLFSYFILSFTFIFLVDC